MSETDQGHTTGTEEAGGEDRSWRGLQVFVTTLAFTLSHHRAGSKSDLYFKQIILLSEVQNAAEHKQTQRDHEAAAAVTQARDGS